MRVEINNYYRVAPLCVCFRVCMILLCRGYLGCKFCVSVIFLRYTTTEAAGVTHNCVPLVMSPVNMASAVCRRFLLQRSTHGFLLSSRARPTLFRYVTNSLFSMLIFYTSYYISIILTLLQRGSNSLYKCKLNFFNSVECLKVVCWK